jgi:hypothetical protein
LSRENKRVPKGELTQEKIIFQVGHENAVDIDEVVVKETLP